MHTILISSRSVTLKSTPTFPRQRRLHMQFNFKEECWIKFCKQLKRLTYLDNAYRLLQRLFYTG